MIPLLEPDLATVPACVTVPDLVPVPEATVPEATVADLAGVPDLARVPEFATAAVRPVFLDPTGRRRVVVWIAAWVLVLLCAAALAAIAAGLSPRSADRPAYVLEG